MPTTISSLPAECLSQIFSYVKADEVEVTDPATFPVNLYLVCKAWRTIVLSTAEIWSRIRIDLDNTLPALPSVDESPPPTDDHLVHSTILSTLQTLLNRSKLQPLTICVRARSLLPSSRTSFDASISEASGQRRRDLLGSILVTLLRNSNRWFDVEFDFPPNLVAFIIPPGRNYPLLRRLFLGGETSGIEAISIAAFESVLNPMFPVRGTFCNTPRLTRLELYRLPTCIPRLSLPWRQITHLELSLHDIFTQGYRFIITIIRRLVSLKLHQLCDDPRSIGPLHLHFAPAAESPTRCAQLEELSLVCPQGIPRTAAVLFSNLETPRLKVLHIQLSLSLQHNHPPEWIPSFRACILRSDCLVRLLTLKEMDGVVAHALLNAMPSVEELVLETIRFTEPLLNGLTFRIRSRKRSVSLSPSKPRLVGRKVSRLAVHKPQFVNDAEGPKQFVTMITSRLPVDPRGAIKVSEKPDDSCAETATMLGVPLTALRVTEIPLHCPKMPLLSESSFALYRLLARQTLKFEKAGLRVEIDEGTI